MNVDSFFSGLRPAVQLLFKGGGSSHRDKDVQDLKAVLPTLSLEEKQWLLESLQTEFPGGHDWIRMLKSQMVIEGTVDE